MSNFRDWLEVRFKTAPKPGQPPSSAAPTVEVDADLADLMPQYLNNRWSDLKFARQLLAGGDYLLLSRMAHRLHSGATNYGFGSLGTIAKSLEVAANAHDRGGAAAQLEAYEAFLRSLRIEYI